MAAAAAAPAADAPIQYGQYRVPPAAEMLNFGVGQPAPSMLPLERVREAAAAKFAEADPLFLQYGVIAGYPSFREALARFLAAGYSRRESAARRCFAVADRKSRNRMAAPATPTVAQPSTRSAFSSPTASAARWACFARCW